MKEQLEAIRAGALAAIGAAGNTGELEALRVQYLGKKGELTAVLKQMGKLSAEERPVMGQLANAVRLCTRGGMLESFLQEPERLTDDDVMLLLKLIFHRQDTQELLKKLLEREKPETP